MVSRFPTPLFQLIRRKSKIPKAAIAVSIFVFLDKIPSLKKPDKNVAGMAQALSFPIGCAERRTVSIPFLEREAAIAHPVIVPPTTTASQWQEEDSHGYCAGGSFSHSGLKLLFNKKAPPLVFMEIIVF